MKTTRLLTHILPAFLLAACLLFAVGGSALASGSAASEEIAAFDGVLDTSDLFTDRDLEQTADLKDAVSYTVKGGTDIHIDAAGVYVISGSASDVTVYVEAGDEDKVQLVLDGLEITNKTFPCVYVKNADKVFITTAADSSLSVTGNFRADGNTKTDGVIFSRTDLVLNGTASLTIASSDNGVVCKDELKITGGSYDITADDQCLEANDAILIADGVFTLTAGKDALHAENSDDDALGYIYIRSGEIAVTAEDDGIHAQSVLQIDGGTVAISAAEGVDATYVQLNAGTVTIAATDNGVNSTSKSAAYQPTVEINGGDLTIEIASDDKDGVDCDGDIIVNGGTINVTGAAAFSYDGSGEMNGGTVIVNGQQVAELPNQADGSR